MNLWLLYPILDLGFFIAIVALIVIGQKMNGE